MRLPRLTDTSLYSICIAVLIAALKAALPPWHETLAKPNPALARYTVVLKPLRSWKRLLAA